MMRRREFLAGLGSAATFPLAARAQRSGAPVIGYLDWNAPQTRAPYVEALRAGLADAGFIEGRNLTIEYRWADGDYRQLPALAADLVRRQVAVIVAVGSLNPPRDAKAATSTIPIVFSYGGDPVKDGLVNSLNRPGSNVTGMTLFAGELGGAGQPYTMDLCADRRRDRAHIEGGVGRTGVIDRGRHGLLTFLGGHGGNDLHCRNDVH